MSFRACSRVHELANFCDQKQQVDHTMLLRSVSCFVVFALCVMFWQCTPAIIQLDPEWTSSSLQDGGTQYLDTSAPIPTTCVPAPSSLLRQSSPISGKRGSLLFGQSESIKNRRVYAIPPQGWKLLPSSVEANATGEFGFWVHRQETPATTQEKITVWVDESWCYVYTPTTTERENQKKIQEPLAQSCRVGQKSVMSLEIQGRLTESTLGFSTQPNTVMLLGLRYEEKSGPSFLHVDYRCLQQGMASLLIGGEDLDAQMISVQVTK